MSHSFDVSTDLLRHTAARLFPELIRPDPREIFVTLTANCNNRCLGCRYGRDFMPGAQLPWEIVRDLLDDCKSFGIRSIRLYGGEPLLYKELPRVVEYAVSLGLRPWLTTNGILLKDTIDSLYSAGLRSIDIGLYGIGDNYDQYVQHKFRFQRLEESVTYVRDRYGANIDLSLGWLLMRPTCTLPAIGELWKFAERFSTPISVNLIHYSLPYFTEGPDKILQFRKEDQPKVQEAVSELIRLKELRPEMVKQSVMALRSIPDWILEGPAMRVPCERYRLLWIGADGTVQMCYVTFKLGNLHTARLATMLYSDEHFRAARSAFALQCPNCHCSYPKRIEIDASSRSKYS